MNGGSPGIDAQTELGEDNLDVNDVHLGIDGQTQGCVLTRLYATIPRAARELQPKCVAVVFATEESPLHDKARYTRLNELRGQHLNRFDAKL